MSALDPAVNRLSICVVSYEDAFIERVSVGLGSRGRVLSAIPQQGALAKLAEGESFDLFISDVDEAGWEGLPNLQIIATIRELWGEPPIIAATYNLDADLVLKAVRAGASDVCDKGAIEAELGPLFERLFDRRAASRPKGSGKLVSILSFLPGTGAYTLAKGLAGELAAHDHKRALILDMNAKEAQPIDVAGAQAYGVHDALKDLSRIDETLVESAFARHEDKGTYYYLPLIDMEEASDAGLPMSTLMAFLGVLRGYFGWIILLPRHGTRSAVMSNLMRESDHSLLCCDQRLINIKACAGFLGALEDIADSVSLRLVVTRYDKKLVPDAHMIASKLGMRVSTIVPYDRLFVDMRANAGSGLRRGLRQPPISRAMEALARKLLAVERQSAFDKQGSRLSAGKIRRIFGLSFQRDG